MLIKEELLSFDFLQKVDTAGDIEVNRVQLLSKGVMRSIKEKLKIPGHQIERLVNILMYAQIQNQSEDMPLAYF